MPTGDDHALLSPEQWRRRAALWTGAIFVALAAMLGISALSSRAIASPLAEVAAQLRSSALTGELPEFPETPGGVQEIRDLTRGFNYAAKAVRDALAAA